MKLHILGASVILLVVVLCQETGAAEPQSKKEETCKDKGPCLASYKKYCNSNSKYEKYMKARCQKFCGYCVPYVPCQKTHYKCCPDLKTAAEGPNKEGCPMKLCYDRYVLDCKKKAKNNKCRPDGAAELAEVKENCPFSCGYCKHQAPTERCKDIGFGCCWNGETALNADRRRGCPECRDIYPHSCAQWSRSCSTGSFYIRKFMEPSCPETCGLCECLDRSAADACAEWKAKGYCVRHRVTMRRQCAKTCDLCGVRHNL